MIEPTVRRDDDDIDNLKRSHIFRAVVRLFLNKFKKRDRETNFY